MQPIRGPQHGLFHSSLVGTGISMPGLSWVLRQSDVAGGVAKSARAGPLLRGCSS